MTIALLSGDMVTVNGNDVITCGNDVAIMLQEWIKNGAQDLEIIVTLPYYQSFNFIKEKGNI